MHLPLKHTSGKATLHPALCAGWGGSMYFNHTLWPLRAQFTCCGKAFKGFSGVFNGFSKAFKGFSGVFNGFSRVFNDFRRAFNCFSKAFNGFSLLKLPKAALQLAKAPLISSCK